MWGYVKDNAVEIKIPYQNHRWFKENQSDQSADIIEDPNNHEMNIKIYENQEIINEHDWSDQEYKEATNIRSW